MKRPNMVGRTNHFKHTPGMGVSVLLLAVGALVAVPFGMILLVVCIRIPFLILPLGCLIYYPFWRRDRELRRIFQERQNMIAEWERDRERFRLDQQRYEREYEEELRVHRLQMEEDNREHQRRMEADRLLHEKIMARIRSRPRKNNAP
jgi:hypothetical protein